MGARSRRSARLDAAAQLDLRRQQQAENQVKVINRLLARLDLWEQWADSAGMAKEAKDWILAEEEKRAKKAKQAELDAEDVQRQ